MHENNPKIYIFWAAFDPPHVGHFALIQAILHAKNPDTILIIPSGERDDKKYKIPSQYRREMCRLFTKECRDTRVVLDEYFFDFKWEMITKDVDEYVAKNYTWERVHIFGSDAVDTICGWDKEEYASKKIQKIFIRRKGREGCFDEKNLENIENYEFFEHERIPELSSSGIRNIIPDHTDISVLYENYKHFHIPGLSKQISKYILENRLYRPEKKKEKLLVHVCCWPDVTMPILQLRDEYDLVCFWYDPNIQPKSEHDKRYEAFKKVCEIEKIPFIKGAYDVKNFFTRIKWVEHTPERWEKCTYCYDMRMYVAAKLAKRFGFKFYTSSLNTSPKKDLEKLFRMGHKYAKKFGITFLDIPFRRRWGFAASVEYTKKHDIFRQNYCGCIYSIPEWGESEMKQKMIQARKE